MFQKAAFVWEGAGGQHGGGGSAGVSGAHGKCGGPAGGQGQGNLVHWMSVMAEHMNNVGTNHHDGIHYMAWNGGVEVSSFAKSHSKCSNSAAKFLGYSTCGNITSSKRDPNNITETTKNIIGIIKYLEIKCRLTFLESLEVIVSFLFDLKIYCHRLLEHILLIRELAFNISIYPWLKSKSYK